MGNKIALFTLMFVVAAGICYAARFSYTWKDADGNLYITDFSPPADAEVLDVRIIPMPEPRQVAPETFRKQQEERRRDARQELLARAAELHKKEQSLRQQASGLNEEALELRRIAKKQHYKERYRRRAGLKEDEAAELVNLADALAEEAAKLEGRAARLK